MYARLFPVQLSTSRQCISCLEEKLESEHQPDTCAQCVRVWIQRSIENQGIHITCPQCPSELEYSAIKELADEATFQRYETLVFNRLLEQDPTFVWCAHACGSGQLHPTGSYEPIMTCHHCRKQTCVIHGLPWHSGLTCRQFDNSQAKDDQASRDLVRGNTKPCPRCRFDIEKAGGCDMMTCKCLPAIVIP
ncbi:hypothetical protein GGR58DRAFT_512448 [Xylaria digitata]|nr:hypothetical protein GGR58DRAFT_512448 [Xylaria digitata]